MINNLNYSQLEPSVYRTEDDFSMYSLDVYSKNPQRKLLSNTYSDLVYVPYYKHFLEWGGIILGLLAVTFSFGYVIVIIIRRIWKKKHLHKLIFTQHIFNLLMLTNVLWIINKTLSMVSYSFLKPFLTFNLIYIAFALINSGFLIAKIKNNNLRKYEKLIWMLTVIFTVILCVNLLYWEFYY